jgi:hypothetical protein
MALNLIRNSRVWFTTNVNTTTGVVAATGFTADDAQSAAYELQVLDGFTFSQNTNSEQVTVSEAGTAPVRGQRSFNTSLAPVDFSFSTYIRPRFSTDVLCEESVLWNALLGTDLQNTAATFTGFTGAPTYSATAGELTISGTGMQTFAVGTKLLVNGIGSNQAADLRLVNGPATVKTSTALSLVLTMDNQSNAVSATPAAVAGTLTSTNLKLYTSAWGKAAGSSIVAGHRSNTNQLQKFGMLILVDGVSYAIDNAALNEATIDFGLDGIATVAWTGQATALRQLATSITTNGTNGFTAGVSGSFNQKNTSAGFITNKLSTCKLKTTNALGAGTVGTGYYLAITGGSITISNNITYITPAILGVVNEAITYFTGTRSVTGTLNAYLNTGSISTTFDGTTYTKGTGDLIADMLASKTTETEPMFGIELHIGGLAQVVRVELQMPSVSLGVPAINTEQVVTTAITFNAGGSTGVYSDRVYDLSQTNELTVRYYAD